MKRHIALALLALLALCGGAFLALLWPDTPESAPEPAPADYNTLGQLSAASLCLEDRTNGFPVEQAAREFEGLVEITVTDDCTGHENVAHVRNVVRDNEGWSGWYNDPSPERDGAALISLNLAKAFRMDPHGWRMVLVHEIGHAVGLAHTFEVDSAMDPLHSTTHDGLTDIDRAQIEELYGQN